MTMKKRLRLSDKQIFEAYAGGVSKAEIARKAGCGREAIYRKLRKWGQEKIITDALGEESSDGLSDEQKDIIGKAVDNLLENLK